MCGKAAPIGAHRTRNIVISESMTILLQAAGTSPIALDFACFPEKSTLWSGINHKNIGNALPFGPSTAKLAPRLSQFGQTAAAFGPDV
jgi:hypothetical protein